MIPWEMVDVSWCMNSTMSIGRHLIAEVILVNVKGDANT